MYNNHSRTFKIVISLLCLILKQKMHSREYNNFNCSAVVIVHYSACFSAFFMHLLSSLLWLKIFNFFNGLVKYWYRYQFLKSCITVSPQRKSSSNRHILLSANINATQKRTLVSYVLRYPKRPNNENIKLINLAFIELHLSEDRQSVSTNFVATF